jgi:hypothetical protein
MKRHLTMVLALAAMALASSASKSHAIYIVGSMALTSTAVSQNGADLSVSSTISILNLIASNIGQGNYTGVANGTSLSNNNTVVLDLTNLSAFSFSSPTWGGFVANGVGNQILNQSTNFLNVDLRGTFTPGTDSSLASLQPTETSFRMSFNQSGVSLSSGFTLDSPPVNVPEPSTYMLAGPAVLILGYLAHRRKNRKV